MKGEIKFNNSNWSLLYFYKGIAISNLLQLSVAFVFAVGVVFVPPWQIHGNQDRQRKGFTAC